MVQIFELSNNHGAYIFMSLHERFKAERERLGFTQPEVATLTTVGKTTVINWEKGSSSPTAAQLEKLAKFGMDVLFVVTGSHAGGVPPAPSLTPEESTMLDYFRQAPAVVRRAALGALLGGVANSPTQVMQNTGAGSVQIGHVGGDYNPEPKPAKHRTK